jgi:Tol biopolymer transport system component
MFGNANQLPCCQAFRQGPCREQGGQVQRMVGMLSALVLTTALLWTRTGVPARAATPDAGEIQRLIAQLGSDEFAQRDAASRRLETIGEPAMTALDEAATTSEDPEVRRRAEQLVQAISRLLFSNARQVRRIAWRDNVQNIPVHIYYTAFSPDGRSYLAGGDIGQLRLWDVATGKQLQEFKGHNGWTCNAVFTPDGKKVLSAGHQDKSLRLWDVVTGRELCTFATEVTSVAISPDGRLALSGSVDKTLRLWDLATGKEVRRLKGHADSCEGIFSPDGKQVLSFSADKTLRLWDLKTGELVRTLQGHTKPVAGVFFMPDGRQVLSYASDKTLRVWDIATGKELRRRGLGDDHCAIRWLAITPDGLRFVTNHQDLTIRVRDLATGRELHRFTVPPGASPQGLSVSPDGRHVASGSWRGFVYLFRLRN